MKLVVHDGKVHPNYHHLTVRGLISYAKTSTSDPFYIQPDGLVLRTLKDVHTTDYLMLTPERLSSMSAKQLRQRMIDAFTPW